MQVIYCWNTNCSHNERHLKPHPSFPGYCTSKTLTIGRKNTESVKCYSNTNTKSQLKEVGNES